MTFRRSRTARAAAASALVAAAAVAIWVLQAKQSSGTRCLTNVRRLATATLLYAQDHDSKLPVPCYRKPDGEWQTWFGVLRAYTDQNEVAMCPANRADGARDPYRLFAYECSYALNVRFHGQFASGAFPLDNLELAERTAMIVEAGQIMPRAGDARRGTRYALCWYWDTGWWPDAHRSVHGGRISVAAADGHAVAVRVAHYDTDDHDQLYGRLGARIYNWNGGYPNGEINGAPRE